MKGNQLWRVIWRQKINTHISLTSMSKHGQLNCIHRVFSKGLLWMVNTRGYKNAPPQQIFRAVAVATNLLINSRCLLPASWMGTCNRNNMEMAGWVGCCLVDFLLSIVGIQMLEISWTEAYRAGWLPGSSAHLRPTTTNAFGVSSNSLRENRGSPWQGHCPHLHIWGQGGD